MKLTKTDKLIEQAVTRAVDATMEQMNKQHEKDIAMMDSIIEKQRDNLMSYRAIIEDRNKLIKHMAKFIGR
jgi:hypothetical protein